VKVEVTAEDIMLGERQNRCHCPIALAVARAVPGVYVGVGNRIVDLINNVDFKQVYLPKEAQEFIESFDNLEPVEPFSFVLDYEFLT